MALEQMEGFELAGRTVSQRLHVTCAPHCSLISAQLRVNTVHEKGSVRYTQQDSLDEAGGTSVRITYSCSLLTDIEGGNLNAASRQALMQKLARMDTLPLLPEPV